MKEEIMKRCVKWYHNNNGEVTTKECFEEGYQQAKKEFLEDEVKFLKSKKIKWLIHEADLDACHQDYKPIIDRIKKLKQKLEVGK